MITSIISIAGFLLMGAYLNSLVKALNRTHAAQVEGLKELQSGLEVIGDMAAADAQDRKLRNIKEHFEPRQLPLLKVNFPIPTSSEVPEGHRRIYSLAYVNRNDLSSQLIMSEAGTYEEALKKAEDFMLVHDEKPKDWILHIASSVEIQETVKETVREPNTLDFINSLRYSRDHFTASPVEKSSLEKVIRRIETKYAKKS